MHKLGALRENGELSVIEKHLVTQDIKGSIDRLQGQIRMLERSSKVALCVNWPGELHDLALKMAVHILEQRGFRVLFTGQITPTLEIEIIFRKWQPHFVFVSGTFVENFPMVLAEWRHVLEVAERYGGRVFPGGRGVDRLPFEHLVVAKRLYSFEEVAKV